ncbi:PucR family transcriptional regulator [Virgibacillus byunsanensis]|uniref:PucR family transcriptional regulator n=1 Tax=Virgibacillus byunsanensis TaxID=570945 RepID=A0ABW3LL32_9BACI
MINKLRSIFPSLITYEKYPITSDDTYKWFITTTDELIGIKKRELTTKDDVLLNTFLQPYDSVFPVPTMDEQRWQTRITTEKPAKTRSTYRFIYFSIQKNQIDPHTFKNAINELFNKTVPVLWENEQEGIIIEEQSGSKDESMSYEQIIDVLMSDLYVKIKFFVGSFVRNHFEAPSYYQTLKQGSRVAFTYSAKAVVNYIDVIPYLFIEKADKPLRKSITQSVLRDVKDDEELLKTIETFIACNLNISVTAKELYMHRNSLQYRIDKFIDITGIDVRQFHQAVTVYLAILGLKAEQDN